MNAESQSERHSHAWEIVWDVLLIVAGLLAIGLPLVAGVGFDLVIGWLLIFGGVAHFVFAFRSRPMGSFAWKFLVGLLYVLSGVYLLLFPLSGVASLTLLFSTFLLCEGILETVAYFQMRSAPGSGWLLADGLITVLLGLFILAGWPASSVWAIGTLVGISMLLSGFSRLMIAMGTRGPAEQQYA